MLLSIDLYTTTTTTNDNKVSDNDTTNINNYNYDNNTDKKSNLARSDRRLLSRMFSWQKNKIKTPRATNRTFQFEFC